MAAARAASAGGRIPGHQSRAVSAGAGAIGAQRKSVRGRRRGPVDLSLARRRYPQHPGFRARLSRTRRSSSSSRITDRPRRSWRRPARVIAEQSRAQGQAAVDRKRGRRAGDLFHRHDRARRGRFYRARDRPADRRRRTVRPADIVVFYRVNAQSRVIEEALVRRRIPYYIVGGLRFYDQREIKDLIAYLRVIAESGRRGQPRADDRRAAARNRRATVEMMAAVAAREGVTLFEAMGRLETESQSRAAHRQSGERALSAGCAI